MPTFIIIYNYNVIYIQDIISITLDKIEINIFYCHRKLKDGNF